MSNSKPAQQGGAQSSAPQQGQAQPGPVKGSASQQQGSQPIIRDWASI